MFECGRIWETSTQEEGEGNKRKQRLSHPAPSDPPKLLSKPGAVVTCRQPRPTAASHIVGSSRSLVRGKEGVTRLTLLSLIRLSLQIICRVGMRGARKPTQQAV